LKKMLLVLIKKVLSDRLINNFVLPTDEDSCDGSSFASDSTPIIWWKKKFGEYRKYDHDNQFLTERMGHLDIELKEQ
jgi:hypothetical protein